MIISNIEVSDWINIPPKLFYKIKWYFYWSKPCLKPYIYEPNMKRVKRVYTVWLRTHLTSELTMYYVVLVTQHVITVTRLVTRHISITIWHRSSARRSSSSGSARGASRAGTTSCASAASRARGSESSRQTAKSGRLAWSGDACCIHVAYINPGISVKFSVVLTL